LPSRLRQLFFLSLILGATHFAFGEGTRTWEQSRFEELVKGTTNGIAIRSLGGLELAPAFKQISTSPSTYIWSIAADVNGNLFVATGSPARVYRITPEGKSEVIFEPQELQVQSVTVDKSGAVYAATNPDGKIYRIERHLAEAEKPGTSESKWSSSVFFEPGTKYIWDLAFDKLGNLFVATGDQGKIFKVTPRREHPLFFKSDEVHIRKLAFDGNGNLIAGSDGSGLVYRISPDGQGFVLYSAPKKEITALAIDKAGNIYAAGAGEKRGGGPGPILVTPPATPAPSTAAPSGQPGLTISGASTTPPPAPASIPSPGVGATGGSEIYRIAPDGSPTRIWTSREDLVYAFAFDARGRLIAGTGNRGHLFAINNEDDYTDLLKASASQITAFASAPGGALYVSTSNLGKVFLLGGTSQPEGSYDSDVFDARIFSRWGRAELRGSGMIDLFARSGNVDNPDRNWSPWTKVEMQKGGEISVPAARFIQWKAVLHASEPPPHVDSVIVNYLPKNVAPDFDDVSVQVGVKYQALPHVSDSSLPGQPHFEAPPPMLRDRDSIGVKWTVHDDNDDQMVYSLYYRGDGDSRWLLLKDQLTDKFYSFDASLLPDGGYTVKAVASDAPSHSPGQALYAEKESSRFEVDTTPPLIQGLNAAIAGDKVHVTFSASDGFSSIKRAEYSIDAGDWQFVEPVGQLSDSKTESYDFQASDPPTPPAAVINPAGQKEHVVVVRVYDRYDNMSSAKFVIRSK